MSIPYKRILLPLDGSKLAESAASDAISIGEAMGSELFLLNVVEPPSNIIETDGRPIYVDEFLEMQRAHARSYLDGLRHRYGGRALRLHVAVEAGAPAEAILAYSKKRDIDLIVMATHGRSGIKRWLIGSVANKVMQGSTVPVLLVQAKDD